MYPLPIGTTEITSETFYVLPDVKRKHVAIFGKSGVGKTTLLRNMIAYDIHEGAGVTVLDPHGSLVEELIELIPRHRTNDVIYLNPQDPQHVLGLNILERVSDGQRPLVVSSLISTLRNIWPEMWGPRTEFILSNVAFALLSQSQPVTLAAIPKLLTDPDYRAGILRHVTDPAVRWFFDLYDNHWNERFREEAISPILNKVSKFITNPQLRAIIAQPTSSFNVRRMMDSNKILLCNLSKGALGEDVSSLLGSLIVTKLSLAALSRQDIPEAQRRSHFLYADEVQNFIHGIDFPTILSEARKYRLTLTIATQTINQLPERSASAVFGNCATIMSFRVSGEDAQTLAQEFSLMLPASQLQDLSDYKLYVRTLISLKNGAPAVTPSKPHLITTFAPFSKAGNENTRERVIRASFERYGRPRAEVEARINKFLSHP